MRIVSGRATFVLESLELLSATPELLLIVSERTLHLLHNVVERDTADPSRYALISPEFGLYESVTEEDAADWELFRSVSQAAELEILEVGTVPISMSLYAESWSFSQANQGPGQILIDGPLVPSGEIWLIESWWCQASIATTAQFLLGAIGDQSGWLVRLVTLPVTINTGLLLVSLGYNAQIRFAFQGVVAGTTLEGGFNYRAIPVG